MLKYEIDISTQISFTGISGWNQYSSESTKMWILQTNYYNVYLVLNKVLSVPAWSDQMEKFCISPLNCRHLSACKYVSAEAACGSGVCGWVGAFLDRPGGLGGGGAGPPSVGSPPRWRRSQRFNRSWNTSGSIKPLTLLRKPPTNQPTYQPIKNVTLIQMSLHWGTTFSMNTCWEIEMILIYPIMFPSLIFVVPVF